MKLFENIKSYFPIYEKYPDLVYLDNAATTQRPKVVLDALYHFSAYENANIHRGIYDLSNNATQKYEAARQKVAKYLGSDNPATVAFTQGTTESINIVARSFLNHRLKPGDNIVVTIMEHHANFIPWQYLANEVGAALRIVPIDESGNLNVKELEKLIDEKTRMLTLNHISNTLGTVNDIGTVIDYAHRYDVPVMIDAAQSAAYYDLDCKKLPYDFLAFSAHKIFGPFGIGVLYAHEKFHNEIDPYTVGGGMIQEVTVDETSFRKYPYNLEAGTSNVSGAIGLASAIDFIEHFDKIEMRSHMKELTRYCRQQLSEIDQVILLGNPTDQAGIVSFTIEEIHPHDVASFLNKDNIAVRAGMHCTQPLLQSMSTPATVRVSFCIYNDKTEVDRLKSSLQELIKFWS